MGDVSSASSSLFEWCAWSRAQEVVHMLNFDIAELNWLVCKSSDAAYYDLYLQTGSDTPSGKTCSNYQTIHLPCLC